MGEKRSYEELAVGEIFDLGETEAREAEIIEFAREYDPQPFHLDHKAAEASPLKGLAASGWHTCSLGNRLFVEGFADRVAARGGAGVEDCRWLKPLYPAERAGALSARLEVLDKRLLQSLPDRGLTTLEVTLSQRDPFGEPSAPPRPLCRMTFNAMIGRRAPGDAAAARPKADAPATALKPPEAVSAEEGFTETGASEIEIGRRVHLGDWTFEADDIVAFARRYDPQDFHLSAEAGRAGPFGGLAASGWHTTAIFMKLFVNARIRALMAMPEAKRMKAIGAFGPSPGFKNLRWRRPVMAGDRLSYYATTVKVEPWRGRDDWMVMTGLTEAYDPQGRLAMSFESAGMVRP